MYQGPRKLTRPPPRPVTPRHHDRASGQDIGGPCTPAHLTQPIAPGRRGSRCFHRWTPCDTHAIPSPPHPHHSHPDAPPRSTGQAGHSIGGPHAHAMTAQAASIQPNSITQPDSRTPRRESRLHRRGPCAGVNEPPAAKMNRSAHRDTQAGRTGQHRAQRHHPGQHTDNAPGQKTCVQVIV